MTKPTQGLIDMSALIPVLFYLAAMVAIIVGVDVACFRHQFWERLMANAGIVLVFGAFYFRYFGHQPLPWK